MIFSELDEETDTDTDTEEQPKKIKYSKFLQEEEFINDDAVIPF
jgi:hypothetical protein